ncbi:MAG: acyl-CoA dehydrogenase [Rhodovibrionaceae bacterium]|nr:acyl-CoA dehydrogenase [Rhodovibrionaceae bacterium]
MIDPLRASAMAATLEGTPAAPESAPKPGDPLPPLWHWAYFWEVAAASGLGPDGHAARGDFLPPIELPRRMWAGSRVRFLRPLPVGVTAERISTVEKVEEKQGRSGPLAFVTVRHRVRFGRKDVIDEEHDIVYRGGTAAASGASQTPPAEPAWSAEVRPDPVLLFRYSALTFNGHRIHYDVDYARKTEGYPGLVVHGPLLASMMVGLAAAQGEGRPIERFAFRALAPVFDTAPFVVAGAPAADGNSKIDLWVAGPEGALAMRGEAAFAERPSP